MAFQRVVNSEAFLSPCNGDVIPNNDDDDSNNNNNNNNNDNNNNNTPEVLKYRVGVRRGITNRFMARLGCSALAGSLSSDGVMIKILVVTQP